MNRKDPTLPIALLAALVVHLLILGAGVHAARQELGWWLQSSLPTPHRMPPHIPSPQNPIQQLGDHDTHGTSINSSPGDRPLESAIADERQDQAILSRDPVGFGGHGNARQLDQILRGNSGSAADTHQPLSSPFAAQESALASSTPKSTAPLPPKLAATDPLPAVHAAEQPQNTPSSAGKPGAPDPGAGNPLPTSDAESFPITHIDSTFIAGKIEARSGRKLRTRQLPRFGEAARADLASMDHPCVVLRLKIDATGNVTDVRTIHSSGSDNLDEPCERAAYTWWFEPLKDPTTGKPRPEIIEFTIYL